METTKNRTFNNEEIVGIRRLYEKLDNAFCTRRQFRSSCVLCNAVIFDYKILITHMETHLFEKIFTRKPINPFKSHKCHNSDIGSINNQLKPSQLKCHLCDYTASRKPHLKRHIDSVHNKLKPHKCQFCDLHFYGKGALKNRI